MEKNLSGLILSIEHDKGISDNQMFHLNYRMAAQPGETSIRFLPTKLKIFELIRLPYIDEQHRVEFPFKFKSQYNMEARRNYTGPILTPDDTGVYGIGIECNIIGSLNFHGYLHLTKGDVDIVIPSTDKSNIKLQASNGIYVNGRKRSGTAIQIEGKRIFPIDHQIPIVTQAHIDSATKTQIVAGVPVQTTVENFIQSTRQYDWLGIRTDAGKINIQRIPPEEIAYFDSLREN